MSTIEALRGRLRAARGRCPRCDGAAPAGCGVCLGYDLVVPPDDATRRRWWARFASVPGSGAPGSPGPRRAGAVPIVARGAASAR